MRGSSRVERLVPLLLIALLGLPLAAFTLPGVSPPVAQAQAPTSSVPMTFTWQAPVPSGPHVVPPSWTIEALPNGTVFIGNNLVNFSSSLSAATYPTSFSYTNTSIQYTYTLAFSCVVSANYTAPTQASPDRIEVSYFSNSCSHTGTYPISFFNEKAGTPAAENSTGGTSGTVCQIQFGETYFSWCGDSMTGATMQYAKNGNSYLVEFVTAAATWSIDPALVQDSSSDTCTANTSCAISFGSSITSGNTILVAIELCCAQGSISSITDSLSNTFTSQQSLLNLEVSSGVYRSAAIYSAPISTGGSDTVTIVTSVSQAIIVQIFEVSGIKSTASASATGDDLSSTTALSTSTSPSYSANSFLLAVFSTGYGVTAGSGFTFLGPSTNNGAEYQIASSSGSTDFPATQSSASSWVDVGTVFPPLPVTQPILVATPTGGSPFTYTVSGCSVSPTSATSGSTATDFTASLSCLLTVTMPAAGTDTRYVFASSASSTTVTTCSTGTCTTFSPTDYYQLQNTFKSAYQDGSPSSGAPVWCTQAGTDTSLGDLTTSGISAWCDYGSVAYAQGFAPGGSSTQQYSATPLTYGLVGYWPLQEGTGTSAYDLSHNNNTGTLANSPTWVTTPFTGLQGTVNNAAFLTVSATSTVAKLTPPFTFSCTLSSTNIGSGYPDCPDFLSGKTGYDLTVNSGSNQLAYKSGDGTTLHEIDTTHCALSDSVSETITVVVIPTSVTFYLNGTVCETDAISWTQVANTGGNALLVSGTSTLTAKDLLFYNYALSASGVAQLYAQTLPNLEQQITSGGNTYTYDYYHQYQENPYYTAVSGTPTGDALNYYYSSLGQSLTDTMTTSPATIWADATTVTVGDHYVSSTERYSSDANVTLTAASTSGPDVSIYHQYAATASYSGTVASGGAPSLACDRYGSPSSDLLTTTATVKWVDSGCSYTITKPSADFPSSGVRYETDYANGTISAATTIDPAFYEQFYVTPGTGISKLVGTEFGSAETYTQPGWLDAGTSVTSTGTASCTFAVTQPSWAYQFGGSALQAWLNTTGSSFGDYTTFSPPYVTFDAAHVSATVCVPSSSGLSVTGVTDDGSSVAYSWTPPLVTFSGDSAFEVNLLGSGSSSPPPGSSGSSVQSTVTTVVTSTTNAAPSAPIPGSEFALVILALGAFGVVLLVYRSRGQIEGDGHDLEAAVKRATSPVAPRLKVPTLDNRKKRKRRQA